MLKFAELRQKPKPELEKLVQDNREKLRQLRFDLLSGKIKNVREIRKLKKEIAQILTSLEESSLLEGGRGNQRFPRRGKQRAERRALETEGV